METLLAKLTISNLTCVKSLKKITEGVIINKCLSGEDFDNCIKKIPNCINYMKELCLRHTILSYASNKYIDI